MKVPEPKIPADLRKALAISSSAHAAWKDLTPIARRDFVFWIDSAKQAETRKRRIERTCEMLVAGKRRPCCFTIVPTNLYKALGTNAKAKAAWKGLTPTERRDFVSWIEGAKEVEARRGRIEKVCEMLVRGERRP